MSFQQATFNAALWRATEETFRGVMDLSASRQYILAMLILKTVSTGALNVAVPDSAQFEMSYSTRHLPNLDQRLNQAFHDLMQANPTTLAGLFADVDFTASRLGSAAQRQTRLESLLEAFNRPELDLRSLPQVANVIGNAYEFLIDSYATMSRSVGGEFYTPSEVASVMARLLDLKPGDSVYDPTCGAGTLLLQCAKAQPEVRLFGQELNHTSWGLALLNMLLHGIDADQTQIKQGDTLREPLLLIDENHIMQFDAIVANPPYSLSNWGADELAEDRFQRFKWGYPPAKTGDMAFISHILSSLKEGGRAAVVMPNGILFRSGVEGQMRERMLKENLLDAVISLPANLFYGTSIPTVMILFKKGRTADSIEAILTPYKDVLAQLAETKKSIASFDSTISQDIDTLAQSLDNTQAWLILGQLWAPLCIEPLQQIWGKQRGMIVAMIQGWWDKYRVGAREIFRKSAEASRNLDEMMRGLFPWWGGSEAESEPAPKKHKRQYRWSRFPRICFIDRLVDTSKSPEPQMVEAYYFEPRPEPKKKQKSKAEEDKPKQKVLL